jgi:hypothetical protein
MPNPRVAHPVPSPRQRTDEALLVAPDPPGVAVHLRGAGSPANEDPAGQGAVALDLWWGLGDGPLVRRTTPVGVAPEGFASN